MLFIYTCAIGCGVIKMKVFDSLDSKIYNSWTGFFHLAALENTGLHTRWLGCVLYSLLESSYPSISTYIIVLCDYVLCTGSPLYSCPTAPYLRNYLTYDQVE